MSNPNEWLGLLRWSLSYTDGTGKSVAKEMSAERRAFLEKAMSEMMIDEAKRMKEIVAQLSEIGANPEDQAGDAAPLFEELEDIVENLDAAWDLVKMGAMAPLIDLLRNPDPRLRAGAAQIVGTCAQNNPKCQEAELELGALAYTTHMCVHDKDAHSRLKALGAVSSLVRNCQQGERDFVDNGDGLLVLVNGLAAEDQPRFVAKCIHLLVFFLTDDPDLRNTDTLERHRQILGAAGTQMMALGFVGNEDINVRLGCLELLKRLPADGGARECVEQRLELVQSGELGSVEENQDEIEGLQAIISQLV
eukprot:TRINITY_DN5562_c0_g1_i2.p1 TRINITY_DN5562_c0_g1~~TRINITY_DN5562_c0_g1_i2.p1  ORF type:complete len:306 (-),score=95.25 TRINITY_DN5562_c0_g1_i2:299-1216(-)